MFIDRVRVRVRAGKGGDGCVGFHREKYVPRGGPDGGNGGKGGDVIFYVAPGETTLIQLHARPHYEAGDGGPGAGNNKTGRGGADIRLTVPPGTVAIDAETGEKVCELVEDEAEAVVAAGGKGGKGNAAFATATRQLPRRAEPGRPGRERTLLVELKIVADIGLVGFPNAGKSTLLNALTSARAKIGDYPFTTLHPVIGVIPLEPDEEAALLGIEKDAGNRRRKPRIILADIPGILEGAHQGAGLGLDFLRHIERTNILLFVIDVSSHREYEPVQAYKALVGELAGYDPKLLKYPRLVALNKIDDPLDSDEFDQVEREISEAMREESPSPWPGDIHRISGMRGDGLDLLRKSLVELIIRLRSGAFRVPVD